MKKERIRYQRKGYGLIFAALLAIGFFYLVPYFGRNYWFGLLNFKSYYSLSYTKFFLGFSLLQHNLIHIVCNAVYYVYYRFEFPLIERYKTNFEEPWPWHANPQGWRSQVKESVLVFLVNSNIIPILIYVPFSMTPVFKEHSLAVDEVPSPLRLALMVFFCMLCEDFTFYWSHRLLHRKEVYGYVHKMHHKYT